MAEVKTVQISHLGITAGYQLPHPIDPAKPTLVLVNPFISDSAYYRNEYEDKALTDKINLLGIEVLGHGKSRPNVDHWTFWDTAIMNLQVMEALGVKKAFVLGTSQGGGVTTRMALLAPDKIEGIIPVGTAMDGETPRAHGLGNWDTGPVLVPNIEAFAAPNPSFVAPEELINSILEVSLGDFINKSVYDFWVPRFQGNYAGDDGRRRLRSAHLALYTRDSLLTRLPDVKCPVLWLHGSADVPYSVPNAEYEIKLFTGSPSAKLEVIQDGQHFLSHTHTKEVHQHVLDFVTKFHK